MQLHFREYGCGIPLIVLHGLFGSIQNWHTVSRELALQYHVFALDQRNHGDSPHSSEMNYALMARDVREFLDARSLRAAHVLGHSMGGKTAMQFALSYPEQVKTLIVADMAPRAYGPCHENIFNALHALDLKLFQSREEIEHALAGSICDRSVRRFLLKNLKHRTDGWFEWKLDLETIAHNYSALNAAIDSAGTFPGPTLFIRGGNSDYVRDDDLSEIKQLFPAAEIETLPGVGHWLHSEDPKAFIELVRRFLGRSAGELQAEKSIHADKRFSPLD